MAHPHTAHAIATLVEECTTEWGIPKEKVLTIITDNGSNMVAAFRRNSEEDNESSFEEDSPQDSGDEAEDLDVERIESIERYGTWERTPCVVHTLQLVVNMIQKEPAIKKLLDKLRHLVRLFRKSSVAIERLLGKCGLTLTSDCPTRWSSTYSMLSRALEVKDHVASVAESMNWDSLQPSEWQKLAILKDLLLPFAEHTKVLESDTNSLSLVVPALLDLRGHLSEFSRCQGYKDAAALAKKMSANMELRFGIFLDVTDDRFSPLAAAACLVDPRVSADVLVQNENEEIQDLLKKAEDYIIRSVTPRIREEETDREENGQTETTETAPLPKRPRFRFFSPSHPARPRTSRASIRQEIQKYKDLLSEAPDAQEGMEFWSSQSDTVFELLKPLALDLLAMPASQAFAEHVFSVTGDLSTGRRNRARTTLERSAFLKLNKV
ncbi:zinc finger BED domain-containing protein 4-like [Pimephales promelas]|uniref:zinc finger BED domain-containing protein 4-like n=1 Tax=Pimephales promelas TaxID=90988 RepID=UPI0019554D7F|nr:zinc finger BED domain-containing protein 4-like [Pimephales promelas]